MCQNKCNCVNKDEAEDFILEILDVVGTYLSEENMSNLSVYLQDFASELDMPNLHIQLDRLTQGL